jgi:cell wall-associated NlpC family hydrolase
MRSPLHFKAMLATSAALVAFACAATPTWAAGGAVGAQPLMRGARGADVRALQKLLDQVGCHLGYDGVFGAATYHCLRWFERSTGLPVDGVASVSVLADIRVGLTQRETGGALERSPGVAVASPTTAAGAGGGSVGAAANAITTGGASVGSAPGITTTPGVTTPGAATPGVTTSTGTTTAGTTTAGTTTAGTTPAGTIPTATPPLPAAPPAQVTLSAAGLAQAPAGAPLAVQQIIAAGNQIATTPYLYGGGHQSWTSPGGYDCSGSVSYVLHAAGLLASPLVSGALASWGTAGVGTWVTIYANAQHVWMMVAGLRFDTGGLQSTPASRWQAAAVSTTGYAVTHPPGL